MNLFIELCKLAIDTSIFSAILRLWMCHQYKLLQWNTIVENAFFFCFVSHKALLEDFESHSALQCFHVLQMTCIEYKALMAFSLFWHLGKHKQACPAVTILLLVLEHNKSWSVITELRPESALSLHHSLQIHKSVARKKNIQSNNQVAHKWTCNSRNPLTRQ